MRGAAAPRDAGTAGDVRKDHSRQAGSSRGYRYGLGTTWDLAALHASAKHSAPHSTPRDVAVEGPSGTNTRTRAPSDVGASIAADYDTVTEADVTSMFQLRDSPAAQLLSLIHI